MMTTMYGVYNEEQNKMLTSQSGRSLYDTVREAKVLKNRMGGKYDSHLTIVEVTEHADE